MSLVMYMVTLPFMAFHSTGVWACIFSVAASSMTTVHNMVSVVLNRFFFIESLC